MRQSLFGLVIGLCLAAPWAEASPPKKGLKPTLLFWHSQDGEQQKFLVSILQDFAKRESLDLKVETGLDMKETLLVQSERGALPDVILAPSDLAALADKLEFSPIPEALLHSFAIAKTSWDSVTVGTLTFGIPLLDGNQLLLYYNKSLVSQPATSWAEMETQRPGFALKGLHAVAAEYDNPFVFMTFWVSHGGWPFKDGKTDIDKTVMTAALEFYKDLGAKDLIPKTCGFDCSTKKFYRGEFAYAINGDWAFYDAQQALGAQLGVAHLPSIGQKTMQSTRASQALFFPKRSLHGEKRRVLTSLAKYLLSKKIQDQWSSKMLRTPVLASSVALAAAAPNRKAILSQLKDSRLLPSDPRMATFWVALKKGLDLYLNESKTAPEAATIIQSLLDSNSQKH